MMILNYGFEGALSKGLCTQCVHNLAIPHPQALLEDDLEREFYIGICQLEPGAFANGLSVARVTLKIGNNSS